jgi:hypothetical protein
MDLQERRVGMHLFQDSDNWRALVDTVMNLRTP